MNDDGDNKDEWLAVIGRSLAFLCLTQADLRDKDLATQGMFLEALGIKRPEIAGMLGANPKSLREVLSRARNRKQGKHGKKKKQH